MIRVVISFHATGSVQPPDRGTLQTRVCACAASPKASPGRSAPGGPGLSGIPPLFPPDVHPSTNCPFPIPPPPSLPHLEDSASPFYARERRFAKTDGGSGDRTSDSLVCLLRKHHVYHTTHTKNGCKTRSNCLNGRTRGGKKKKRNIRICLSQSHRFGSRVRIRSFTHPCLVILLLRSVPHSAAK